jgi:hypothetical protein
VHRFQQHRRAGRRHARALDARRRRSGRGPRRHAGRPGNFTVFAPTNAAFDALPPGTLEALLNDIPALTNILTYHVSADYYPAEALLGQRGRVPTVQGGFLRVDARGAGVHINGNTAVTTPTSSPPTASCTSSTAFCCRTERSRSGTDRPASPPRGGFR